MTKLFCEMIYTVKPGSAFIQQGRYSDPDWRERAYILSA